MINNTSPLHPFSKGEGSKPIKKTVLSLLMILLSAGAFAQDASQAPVEMATGLYQSGKIYVVVIVLSVIMTGILGYLIMLDRKVSKLEKEVNK